MKKYYVGIDIGGTNTKIGILDDNAKIYKSINIKTESVKGYEYTISHISSSIEKMLDELNISKDELKSIGIGVPGPVLNNSTVKFFANFPWPKNLEIKKEFSKYFNCEIFADNDVNVISMGEAWQGAGQNHSNILTVAIGTGIGGGIIVNGKPLSGKNGAAGEIGHLTLEKNGTLCGCGKKGCFEAYASATGIAREAVSRLMVNKQNMLYEIYEKKGIVESKDVFDCAKKGDEFSIDIVKNHEIEFLALGLSNALNLLDPDVVILGGGMAHAGDMLFDELKERLKKYTLPVIVENLEIKKAILGDEAGIYGAVYLAKMFTK